MTVPTRRSALAALDRARPAIARLDPQRDTEDLAADIIEGWSAVETALRSLVGGSALAGQALIREARQRQLLGFEQANSLAEFYAARERMEHTDYRPTPVDVSAARDGFLKFESSLMTAADVPPTVAAASTAPLAPLSSQQSSLGGAQLAPAARGRFPGWAMALIAAIVLIVGLGIAYALTAGRKGNAVARGVQDYRRNQREAAVGEFNTAVRDDPNDATPHVYLSRMAREVGNLPLAGQEAQLALKADPNSEIALREMAAYLLTAGNYELARRFYVRTLSADSSDRLAQGYLGCTLVKLGRIDEGTRWLSRAGQGSWSSCAPLAGASQPPVSGISPRP